MVVSPAWSSVAYNQSARRECFMANSDDCYLKFDNTFRNTFRNLPSLKTITFFRKMYLLLFSRENYLKDRFCINVTPPLSPSCDFVKALYSPPLRIHTARYSIACLTDKDKNYEKSPITCTASIGTFVLEFGTITYLTGKLLSNRQKK